MIRRLPRCSLNSFAVSASQGIVLVMLITLLSGLTCAQERKPAEYDAAVRATHEAARLFDIGTKESLEQAIQKYQEAAVIFRSLNLRPDEAQTTASIANAYRRIGEYRRAIEGYSRVLELRKELKDNRGSALSLTHMGALYLGLKEYRKSIQCYTQALEIWRAVNDMRNEATSLTNLCYLYLYDELNEKQKAVECCSHAIPLWRKLQDPAQEAEALNLMGLTYLTIDENEKALDPYTQALALYRKANNSEAEADVLHRIAMAYGRLGQTEKALDNYDKALGIQRENKYLEAMAATLDNLALIFAAAGNNQKALELYEEALRLARQVGDREGEGAVLSNLGLTYYRMGQNQEALEFYQKAMALKQHFADRRHEANTLSAMGMVFRALGKYGEARRHYLQALQISRELADRTGQIAPLFNLARLDIFQNDLHAARKQIEEAIMIIESLRAAISDRELRTSYFSTVQDYYELYIEILMRLHKQHPNGGHDAEALQINERARARALLETLAEANADIRQGIAPALLGRERSIQQQLNVTAHAQMKLLSGSHTEEQARTIRQEIEALTTELQQVETEIRRTSPRYAALTQPVPLSLKEIQTKVLDQDTLLLEYSLGPDKSYLWAVTSNSITSFELPGRNQIGSAAEQFYELIAERTSANYALDVLRSGKKSSAIKVDALRPSATDSGMRLSQMLLGPVAAQMGNKRLLIVPDGALQYVPFGALPSISAAATDKYQPLVVEHEIVTLPSVSTIAVLRNEVKDRKPAAKTVAVLADPVFESRDERVKGEDKRTRDLSVTPSPKKRDWPLGFEQAATESGMRGAILEIPRLRGTREEAKQILALVPAAESKQALDFSASRATAMSTELSQYRYVHFATHGFLDSQHPELSGIVFSMVDEDGKPQDGFLRAHEVFNLKLPAELVVLSACQTGLGKEVRGEGLVGLTRGFMYAGAPRVVVSLWSVNDEATAELMAHFYRGMLRGKLRPAAALRAAQVSLMKEKQWQSPFYWAAFTLQGEWK